MKKANFLKASVSAEVLFTIISCNKKADKAITQPEQQKVVTDEMMSENGINPDEAAISANATTAGRALRPEAKNNSNGYFLYTETNSAAKNSILVYKVKNDGSLQFKTTVNSGGSGTDKSLGSQGALALDKNHEWLYAVNAGSNSVSSFRVNNNRSLTLAYTAGSRGTEPVSVTVHDNLLYILNISRLQIF